jgi:hypothetical protein
MRLQQYLNEAKLQKDEKKFLSILNKLYRQEIKKELDRWGKESARVIALDGILSDDVWDRMNIKRIDTKSKILKNLSDMKKIVINSTTGVSSVSKKYNYGRDVVYKNKQWVNIKVRPRLKEDG